MCRSARPYVRQCGLFPVEGFGRSEPAGAVHVGPPVQHHAELAGVAAGAAVPAVPADIAAAREPVAADTEVVVVADNAAAAVEVDAADCTAVGVVDIAVAGVVAGSGQDSHRALRADRIPLLRQATASRLAQAVS